MIDFEVKWSDRQPRDPGEIKGLLRFCEEHAKCEASITTRTIAEHKIFGKRRVEL